MTSARLYEIMVAGLTDFAVFLTDRHGRITSWHPGVHQLLGYVESEWIGQQIEIIFTPADRADGIPERECARAARDNRAPDIRWHCRKDGSQFYVEGTLVALKDDAGELLGFAKVMRDITSRKRTEDDLRRSERRQAVLLRVLAEQREAADPAVMTRVASEALGQYLRADRAGFFEMAADDTVVFGSGWTAGRLPLLKDSIPAEWIGTRYLAQVRLGRTMGITDARLDPLTADSRFPDIGTVALIGAPIIRKGRWQAGLYVNHSEARVWTGEEVALVREVADLTWDAVERVRAEDARRVSEERLALALEAAGTVGTWDWDVGADLVHCSERFARMFSIDPARAAAGVPVAEFTAVVHPDEREAVAERIQLAVANGPFLADYRVVKADGSERWIHALGHCYKGPDGQPGRFPGTAVDITELKEMERALRRSEQFNRSILESTRDCIKVLDLDAQLLAMNSAGQEALGIDDCEPFLNSPWLNFWKDPEDRFAAEAAVQRARAGDDGHFEGHFATLRGDSRWWDVRITPILGSNGLPERLLAVSRDITERKHSEEALRRARDHARVILESIADGFFVLDSEWRFVYANPAGEQLLRRTRNELLGKNHWELYQAAVGTEGERQYYKAVREQTPVEFDYFYPEWQRWYSIKAAPTQEGGLSVFFRDITEHKMAADELRRQWQTFDTALSHTPDLICTFDLEGRFTYANASLLSLFRMPLDQLRGKSFADLNFPPELTERLLRQIRQVVTTKQPLRDSAPFSACGGETRELEYIFAPIIGEDGKVEAIADSTRDVTDRLRSEEQELRRQAQLRDSARLESLGIMAGGIAHDFNNLLVGVLGNASLLVETGAVADRALASQIVLAAERAAELTKQMLAYSGKGHFVIDVVDLNALIRENLALLRASLSKTVIVKLILGDDAGLVEADRAQLQQVVMNLIINGSEAIGDAPGTVTVRTASIERTEARLSPHLHTEVPGGRYTVLEVQDSGSGMAPDTLDRIFDPFFTTKFTGRGLGLAAVLGIVKGHRGDIEVETAPGEGTTFRVFLPISERKVVAGGEKESVASARARGETVLVVDDEDIVRRAASAALEQRGFRMLQAANGEEALAILRGGAAVSAIILDLTMPVMTGEQALPLIRAEFPKIPIILSSGFGEAEILRRFATTDIAAVLQKPYTASAVVQRVMKALQAGLPQGKR